MKAGVYRHYKGGLYFALGVAHDANADSGQTEYSLRTLVWADDAGKLSATLESVQLSHREVVVYISLHRTDEDDETSPMAVRTVDDFHRKLCGVSWEEPSGERCWGCFKPLRANDYCPDHGFTNRIVRRFTYLGRD